MSAEIIVFPGLYVAPVAADPPPTTDELLSTLEGLIDELVSANMRLAFAVGRIEDAFGDLLASTAAARDRAVVPCETN